MTTGHDDDALSWSGDDDPTLVVGAQPTKRGRHDDAPRVESPDATAEEPVALPDGFTPVGRGADEVGRIHPDGTVTMPGEPAPMGNASLIGIGVLGGIYLLYVVGWIIGGLRLQGKAEYLVADVMFQGSFWLAVLAPVLWFATVFLLTMRTRPWVRFAWLVAGVALLVPWPFIMMGSVGR